MYDRILFPTDGSDGAAATLDHVLDIGARHESTVHVLHVADTTQDSVTRVGEDVVDVLEREGEGIVEDAADRVRQRGIEVVTEVLQGEPYRTIVDYADEHDIDLVVMPTRGRRGLERLLVGSTTERVIRRSEVPVLAVRPDSGTDLEYPYRDVLVPVDGSECARGALEVGIDVATAAGAAIHLVSVVDVSGLGTDLDAGIATGALEAKAEEIIEEASAVAREADVDSVTGATQYGSSVSGTIRSYVEENDVDLVVMGTHGRTGFDRYLLGSVTETTVRTSTVPVLTVRESRKDSDQ